MAFAFTHGLGSLKVKRVEGSQQTFWNLPDKIKLIYKSISNFEDTRYWILAQDVKMTGAGIPGLKHAFILTLMIKEHLHNVAMKGDKGLQFFIPKSDGTQMYLESRVKNLLSDYYIKAAFVMKAT